MEAQMSYEYSDTRILSLRQQIFKLLDKNHDLKPLELCKLMDIDYQSRVQTIAQYRKQWKREYRVGLGSKCLKYHRVRGWLYALRSFDRERAKLCGWVLSGARNRALLWRDPQALGRVEWFETGRVNFFLRKPSSQARLKQLLANGFMWTGLIGDVRVFEEWVKSAQLKGAHLTLDLGVPLPYSRTELLKDCNGVVAKTGDLSHPSSLELEFCYPDWAERNELVLKQLQQFFRDALGLAGGQGVNGSVKPLGDDYSS
jgi:hypothetical protein